MLAYVYFFPKVNLRKNHRKAIRKSFEMETVFGKEKVGCATEKNPSKSREKQTVSNSKVNVNRNMFFGKGEISRANFQYLFVSR